VDAEAEAEAEETPEAEQERGRGQARAIAIGARKRGHKTSASVHTFGGSHCSSASVANLEEFGFGPIPSVAATVGSRSSQTESALEEMFLDATEPDGEVPIDFSRPAVRA
jgi:hypothetical protein